MKMSTNVDQMCLEFFYSAGDFGPGFNLDAQLDLLKGEQLYEYEIQLLSCIHVICNVVDIRKQPWHHCFE